ncbi:unnamed protein product [Durusdinium trenchii]|uniref:Calmodulin n=1 Tax=Durusdinium trenchii TaxID=1381693 RepID=A0ABP0KC98_9DINO
MPGGIMLRRITFYNTMLGSQQVEEQYLNSRYQREKKPPPQQLALSPAMKKSAPYLWIHGSFLCEFADCFISSAGGDLVHLLRSFVIGLEGACKSVGDGPSGGAPLWSPQQQTVLHDIVELFQRSEPLFKKWQPLWTAEDHAVPSLAASYVRRLQTVRQNLRNQGGRLLIPLGIKTLDIGSQMIMLILEKQDGQTYRLTIINSGMPGLDWHATSSAEPPKFKSQAALAFDNIPSWKAEDDAFWAMLVVTSAIPPSPMMAKEPLPIYDKFIPWLIGCPLEHYLVTNVYAFDGQAPEQEQCEAGQDLRTPQYGGTGAWRCMTFALRFLLRDAGLPVVGAKFMKWHLRRSFLKLAIKDLASASALSTSERTILRIAAKQFALGAVKVSNRLAYDAPDLVGAAERLLCDARAVVSELEAAVNAKPGAHHVWNDPSVLPVLDLQSGAEEQQPEAWGLHPFFERLLRTDVSPGAATGVPLLVPINLLQVPTVVNDLDEVHRALQLCEILCAKLAFVGKERCKFSPYLRVSLLQHVFTELIPLPLGPATQKAPLNLRDHIWAPEGWDAVHPQMTRACQLELLLILRRLAEHFAAAACTLASNKGFDATKITVFGAIATIADRVARTTVRRSRDTGAEEGPSGLTEALNGTLGGRPVAVDPNTFLVQSETIETAAPELNLARTAICAYFCEVMSHYEIKKLKDETLFDWDTYGWMMYVEREKGLERIVKQMCAKHLLETGKDWGKLVAGNQSENAYLVRTWPEFAALRDIMFFWKYFLCTDLRVFPDTSNWSLQAAYLAWNVANENEVFGPPTNRGAIFQVSAFGQDHVLKTNEPNYRPKPSASGHRYASAALASKYTGRAVVRTEDDLLYLRSLPTFEDRLRPSDAEALLSFLTVPYIRMPLMLAFFTSADRVNCLFSDTLRSILHAVILEPGKFLMPGRWHDCPQMVPAASAAEAELLATPFGQLLTELSCSPKMPLSLSGRLLELALVLANSVTSDTVGVVLFAIRVAARVESATSLLLRAHSGGIRSSPLLAASLNMSESVLGELRAGKQYLRRLFSEAFQWIDTWLDELKDLIKKEAGAQDAGRPEAQRAREAETKQKRVDEHMRCACNLHAHSILMLRNVDLEEDGPSTVCSLLSSFAFLSMHHTFNLQDGLDIPEPELFEIYHRHRRHLVVWFEKRMEKKEYKNFNSVLQTVHEQFSALDAASSIDTAEFEWGSIGGDIHNAGRYCVVGRKRSEAERGEITSVTEDKSGATWVELNVQLLQVTVRGRYVTPLEEETSGHSDFRDILRLRGREAKTVQCAALLSTDLVKVRELLSFPFRTLHWMERPSNALPVLTDADRIYDVEDLDASEGFIAELFEPVRRQFFAQPVVPQDILFFLQEEIPEGAAVAMLTGVHPRIRGRVWKEVLVFRELRVVHIYGILNYGGQCYRRLEYTTNCKYALSGLQPAFQNRPSPWPEWGRHQAGKPETEPKNFPPSVVLSRTLVRRTPSKGTGEDGREPLDDTEQWSDGDVSEEEDDEGERTVWERAQREGEQYLPQRVLEGLLPEALLKTYRFYQTNSWPHRVIHGYKLNEQKEEEEESGTPQHFVEVGKTLLVAL